MKNAHIPQPQNVRSIQGSFAWIDHRLLRHGYLPIMTHEDQALYLFLILAADRHGVSFYRKERICDTLSLTFQQFDVARDRLINLNLVAYQGYSILSPNGYYQVLPIRTPAPNPGQEVWRKVAEQWVHT
jgi:replication initiation and membrane attachment protein DnaB